MRLFKAKLSVPLGTDTPIVDRPFKASSVYIAEFELLASVLNRAYRSPGKSLPPLLSAFKSILVVVLPWRVQDYVQHLPPRPTGFNREFESKIIDIFLPLHSPPYPLVTDPVCIMDNQGTLLHWYLPGCLSTDRQVMLPWQIVTHS